MVASLLLVLSLARAPQGVARPSAEAPRKAAPRPAAEKPSTGPRDLRAVSSADLFERVRALNQGLEFEAVVPVAQELVGRSDASLDVKRETWLILGSAFVIMGDPVAAQLPFTQLLRVSPDFELPASTEPKVVLVFRKVQQEEREIAKALKVSQRRTRIAAITVTGEPPNSPRGGVPLQFEFLVKDPGADVRAVRLAYRRPQDATYSTLALSEAEKGLWRGQLPAEVSANENGLQMLYYAETSDTEGPLQTLGLANEPLKLEIAPGQVQGPRRFVPKWVFVTSSILTLTSGAVAGTLALGYKQAQDDFQRYTTSGEKLNYPILTEKQIAGQQAATRATVALIATGVFLVVTGLLALFVNWSD